MKDIMNSKDFNSKEFKEYVFSDLKTTNKTYLNSKFQEFFKDKGCEAFVLRLVTKTKVVVCEACYKAGQVRTGCAMCGGRGTHKKSYQCYEVTPHKIKIEKIDRDPKNGKLRYWTSMHAFYYEETYHEDNKYIEDYPNGVHFVHFNLEEAETEANRLNVIRKLRGEI